MGAGSGVGALASPPPARTRAASGSGVGRADRDAAGPVTAARPWAWPRARTAPVVATPARSRPAAPMVVILVRNMVLMVSLVRYATEVEIVAEAISLPTAAAEAART